MINLQMQKHVQHKDTNMCKMITDENANKFFRGRDSFARLGKAKDIMDQ